MVSLFDSSARSDLIRRFHRLAEATPPRWGKFTAPQMLAHVNDALRMGLGEIPTYSLGLPLRYPPLKQLMVYWMPWGRGIQSPPELLRRSDTAVWEVEFAAFPELLERCGSRGSEPIWPEHPFFGQMSTRAWGVLGYRHTAHHFTQFGV